MCECKNCIAYISTYIFYCSIANCKETIVARWQKVKQMMAERKAQIMASLAWQQFSRDADEVSDISFTYKHTYVHLYTYGAVHEQVYNMLQFKRLHFMIFQETKAL